MISKDFTMNRTACSRIMLKLMTATLLVLLFALPVSAKETKGQTMRIGNVEGVVATQTGDLNVKIAEKNMALDNAVRIVSAEKSYCWVKLDNSKLVKLDAASDMTIVKNGKAFDVYLNSGNLYFDVSRKLKSDEALRFHTGDYVTNIVGTIGYIQTDNGGINISILEGQSEFKKGGFLQDIEVSLTADSLDDKTGKSINGDEAEKEVIRKSVHYKDIIIIKDGTGVSVSSAKSDVSVSNEKSVVVSASNTGIIRTKQLTTDDIPGFVAIEIKNSSEAQRRILNSDASLDVNNIKESAESRLLADSKLTSDRLKIEQEKRETVRISQQIEAEKKEKQLVENSNYEGYINSLQDDALRNSSLEVEERDDPAME